MTSFILAYATIGSPFSSSLAHSFLVVFVPSLYLAFGDYLHDVLGHSVFFVGSHIYNGNLGLSILSPHNKVLPLLVGIDIGLVLVAVVGYLVVHTVT